MLFFSKCNAADNMNNKNASLMSVDSNINDSNTDNNGHCSSKSIIDNCSTEVIYHVVFHQYYAFAQLFKCDYINIKERH